MAGSHPHVVIVGVSEIGPLHLQKDLPCQDACAFESLPPDFTVIAVADGLGSAAKSDLGARTAVEAAVHGGKVLAVSQPSEGRGLPEVTKRCILAARSALEEKATYEQCQLRDLACTIIVVMAQGNTVCVGHIGDGAVVVKTTDGLRLLSSPGESEYTNEVTPLTSDGWEESLRVSESVSGVFCVAVFTDGCQRAALKKSDSGLAPFGLFFEPLFAYVEGLTNVREGEEDFRDLLASKKICDNSEDDKTLVVAVLGRG